MWGPRMNAQRREAHASPSGSLALASVRLFAFLLAHMLYVYSLFNIKFITTPLAPQIRFHLQILEDLHYQLLLLVN